MTGKNIPKLIFKIQSNKMTGFFYGKKTRKLQELKKKSELTEKFIRLVDELNLDYKNVPPTKKGMERAVQKLMKKLDKKLKK